MGTRRLRELPVNPYDHDAASTPAPAELERLMRAILRLFSNGRLAYRARERVLPSVDPAVERLRAARAARARAA